MKRSLLLLSISFGFIANPSSVAASDMPIIAVFDIEVRGSEISPGALENLSTYLTVRLTEEGFQVIPRDDLRVVISEQKELSYNACYDQSCQIEIGKELAAQKTLSTVVLRIASTCQVTSVLYDLRKAATEQAATAAVGCSEKELLKGVDEIAARLSRVRRRNDRLSAFEKLREAVRSAPPQKTDQKSKPDPESQPAVGVLRVTSSEPGDIILDGETTGQTTPSIVTGVNVGERRIEVRSSTREGVVLVQLEESEIRNVYVDLTKARQGDLLIAANHHPALLVLDGKRVGELPQLIQGVEAGEHSVKVTAEDLDPWEDKVWVKADTKTEIVAKIPPKREHAIAFLFAARAEDDEHGTNSLTLEYRYRYEDWHSTRVRFGLCYLNNTAGPIFAFGHEFHYALLESTDPLSTLSTAPIELFAAAQIELALGFDRDLNVKTPALGVVGSVGLRVLWLFAEVGVGAYAAEEPNGGVFAGSLGVSFSF